LCFQPDTLSDFYLMMDGIIVSCDSDEVEDSPDSMAYCHIKEEMEDSVPLVDSQVVGTSEDDDEEEVQSEGTNDPEEDTNKAVLFLWSDPM
jgi:hypothetical protein